MPMLRSCGGRQRPIVPSSLIAPPVGRSKPGEHHQSRGLARAARSEQRDELAALDLDRDVVDRVADAVIGLHHMAQTEIGVRHHRPPNRVRRPRWRRRTVATRSLLPRLVLTMNRKPPQPSYCVAFSTENQWPLLRKMLVRCLCYLANTVIGNQALPTQHYRVTINASTTMQPLPTTRALIGLRLISAMRSALRWAKWPSA